VTLVPHQAAEVGEDGHAAEGSGSVQSTMLHTTSTLDHDR
jgi:hypothetical protein